MKPFKLPVFKRHLMMSVLLVLILIKLCACQQDALEQPEELAEVNIENTPSSLAPTDSPTEVPTATPTNNQSHQAIEFEFIQITDEKITQYHPQWSPDGKTLGFVSNENGQSEIWLLHENETEAVQFSLNLNGDFAFIWSPDGTQIVLDAYDERDILAIWLMDFPDGEPVKLSDQPNGTAHADWSPDGSQIIYQTHSNLYIHNLASDEVSAFLETSSEDWHPKFSPDGETILFSSMRSGNVDLWMITVDGGDVTQITFNETYDDRGVWSPDGKFIAFVSDRAGNDDIWLLEVETENLTQITTHDAVDSMPAWHPDGQSIVFVSERSGNMDIWSADVSAFLGN